MAPLPYSDDFYQQTTERIHRLGKTLAESGIMLGTAESCTGGLLSALFTEVPGSSAWFAGGVVSYANAVKQELLGVPEKMLAEHGAVSREVVEAMAGGLVSLIGVKAGISISGIAGPGGGTLEKPVGTVWLGLALLNSRDGNMRVGSELHVFSGSRQEIRAAAVLSALQMLETALR